MPKNGWFLRACVGALLVVADLSGPCAWAGGRGALRGLLSETNGVTLGTPTEQMVVQDFSADPQTEGWRLFGDVGLFQWDGVAQDLVVTWDSSRSNSYLQLPLGTIVTRNDDFRAELDLLLTDIAGGSEPGKPGPMQLAFGFQNRAQAQGAGFDRSTGRDSPNLVEFNFFPDTGFGPTVWPIVSATNASLNYNGSGDYRVFDLPIGITLHIVLAYTASNQTVSTVVTTNGGLVGPIASARLTTNSSGFGGPFTQFAVDTFAISSYSSLALAPGPNASSLLAHGVIDNLRLTFPSPPIQAEQGRLAARGWAQTLISRPYWNYVLQATTNFQNWTEVSARSAGTGETLLLQDTNNGDFSSRFYRIEASRAD